MDLQLSQVPEIEPSTRGVTTNNTGSQSKTDRMSPMIRIQRQTTASSEDVWQEIADLQSHSKWMWDAIDIRFRTAQRNGVGTTMDVQTRVGLLRTVDTMEVVGWREGRSIEVVHRGLVTGRGLLEVTPAKEGSTIAWTEELQFPWWTGGALIAAMAKPILSRIWSENLARLDALVTDP